MAIQYEMTHKNVVYDKAYHRISQVQIFCGSKSPKTFTVNLNVDSYSDDTIEEFLQGKVHGITLDEKDLNFPNYYAQLCEEEDFYDGKKV